MNRIKLFTAVSAVFLLSCNSYDCNENLTGNLQPSATSIVIKAYFDTHSSKTVIDDEWGNISWSDSDSISLFTAIDIAHGGAKFICGEGGSTAQFTSADESFTSEGPFFALYPYSQFSSFDSGSKIISTVLPEEQQLLQSTFDPNSFISTGFSNDTSIGFTNICGGIRFTVTSPNINKVVFKSNDGEQLCGAVNVNLSGSTPSSCFDPTADNAPNSIILLSDSYLEPGKHYYISTLPQELISGFTMNFYDDETLVSTTVCRAPVTIKRSVFATIQNADDQTSINKIIDGTDISLNGTANCYIVSKSGYYKFLLTKGNDATALTQVDSLSLLWETVNTDQPISKNTVIANLMLKGAYAYFSTPDEFVSGNALIAAYSKGKIIWSWHVWCCEDFDPELTKQQHKPGSDYMMDRNLGALSSSPESALSMGLLYQWGRKDPFMGAASYSGNSKMYSTNPQTAQNERVTVSYSIQIPTVFVCCEVNPYDWCTSTSDYLWCSDDGTKTQYDPCPAGWRIPYGEASAANPWSGVDYEFVNDGVLLSVESPAGTKAWYPSCGFLSLNNFSLNGVDDGRGFYHTVSTTGKSVYSYYFNTKSEDYNVQISKPRAEGYSVRCIKE